MVTSRGLSMPALAGSAATSTKLGSLRVLAREESLLVSRTSPGLVSFSSHGADSEERVKVQELEALVETKETDWGFSILKKSLLSHSGALGSTLFKGSQTVSTSFGSLVNITYRPSAKPSSPSGMGE